MKSELFKNELKTITSDDIRDFVMNILPKEFQDIILEFERKY